MPPRSFGCRPSQVRLCIPLVHADDVADAFVRVIERRATGVQPGRRTSAGLHAIADVLGAKPITFLRPYWAPLSTSVGVHGCNRSTGAGWAWRSACRCDTGRYQAAAPRRDQRSDDHQAVALARI